MRALGGPKLITTSLYQLFCFVLSSLRDQYRWCFSFFFFVSVLIKVRSNNVFVVLLGHCGV